MPIWPSKSPIDCAGVEDKGEQMSQLKVQPEQLGSIAAATVEANVALQEDVVSLGGAMGDLAQSWTGEAHTAFAARFGDWEADMQASAQLLATIGSAVTAAQQRYSDADAAVGALWKW